MVPLWGRSKRRPHGLALVVAAAAASAAAAAAAAFVPHCQPRLQRAAAPRVWHHWAPATLRGLVARSAAASEAAVEEEAPAGILGELLELASSAAEDGGQSLAARIDEDFAQISPEDLSELQMMMGRSDSTVDQAAAVAAGIQAALDKRMSAAKNDIEELISSAHGDVNVGIRKCLKKQESPLPMLIVLQLNIEQAKSEGSAGEEKMRALLHINTVINEELEKKASRVQGLLNKLLRIDDAGIRDNLLRHHLTPVEVAAPPDDPFDEGLDAAPPQLAAALVPPSRLAMGISQLIGNIDRQLRVAVGETDDRFEMTERIRSVAKEARLIIGEVYGEAEMNAFGADLTPAFTALMDYKAKQAQPEPAEQPVEQAANLPPPEPLPPTAPVQA